MRNLGCAMVFHPLPDDLAVLADGVPGPQGEWLSGALQCLHLMEAKRFGADFYSINPNAAYSDAFFDGLLRLGERGEPAVLLAGPQVKSDAMRRALARFRQDDDRAPHRNRSYGSEYRLNSDEARCRKWVRIGNHHPQSMRDAIREREPILDSKASL
jgi:hypothetical protein